MSLGMAKDPRVKLLADSLVEWQWPDGGWNCDVNPSACHSSFHESIKPLWGLLLYHQATGDETALGAARRTAEMLLEHRLFRSSRTGEVISEEWTRLHWPVYWHYDLLTALDVLRLLPGALADPRAQEALDLVEEQRLPEGKWKETGRRHYRLRQKHNRGVDVTDWGPKREASKHITLRAMRVLRAAGRAG